MSRRKNIELDKVFEEKQREYIEKCERYKKDFIEFIKEREKNENERDND